MPSPLPLLKSIPPVWRWIMAIGLLCVVLNAVIFLAVYQHQAALLAGLPEAGGRARLSGKPDWASVFLAISINLTVCFLARIAWLEVRRRERADARRSDSVQRFEQVFEKAAIGIGRVSLAGAWIEVNARLCEIVGYTAAELCQLNFQEMTYPADIEIDLSLVEQLVAGTISECALEKRYIHREGRVYWVRLHATLVRRLDGAPDYLVVIVEDVDEQVRSDEALAKAALEIKALTQLQLTAQEDERKRLSRELHDEMGQSLAALNLLLAAIGEEETSLAKLSRLQEARDAVSQIVILVRDICSRLRPPQIDDLGLGAATRWYLKQVFRNSTIDVRTDDRIGMARYPVAIELAAFRVIQEALTNLLRHSKATEVVVSLWADEEGIQISVADNGRGFDLVAVEESGGFGLIGMRERALALGGELFIKSEIGRGTTIVAKFGTRS